MKMNNRHHGKPARRRPRYDHDVNGLRRAITTLCAEEDAEPTVAIEATLVLAAQLVKLPPPGEKKHGLLYFLWRAWRAWRCTKILQEKPNDQ